MTVRPTKFIVPGMLTIVCGSSKARSDTTGSGLDVDSATGDMTPVPMGDPVTPASNFGCPSRAVELCPTHSSSARNFATERIRGNR
ncbi:MAG: hypothetical protein HUU55_09120 [Myxococcales bacterium]|nr:hypothetical protein [Myxococcales bacterium]